MSDKSRSPPTFIADWKLNIETVLFSSIHLWNDDNAWVNELDFLLWLKVLFASFGRNGYDNIISSFVALQTISYWLMICCQWKVNKGVFIMRLANGIVLDKEKTFGMLKFSALRQRSKHRSINIFFWHFHNELLLSFYIYIISTPYIRIRQRKDIRHVEVLCP